MDAHATPSSAPWAERLGVAVLAASGAICAVRWLTMRTVYVEYDVPAYGFPLPAFGHGGVSSLEWKVAVLPLVVDLVVAAFVSVPVAVAAVRRLPRRWLLGVCGAAVAGMAWALLPVAIGLLLGWTHLSFAARFRDWPVECRSPWLGEAHAFLRYDDPTDVCAAARLERRRR